MADYTVDVTFQNGTFTFSGSSDSAGDMNVNWGSGSSKTIAFKLYGATGDTWAGVKITRDQEKLQEAPAALDTQGQFYGNTCFKVGPTAQTPAPPLLLLTDVDRVGIVDSGAWFYCLGIQHSDGSQSWPDPKIENPGGDSPFRPPGLYFGALPETSKKG